MPRNDNRLLISFYKNTHSIFCDYWYAEKQEGCAWLIAQYLNNVEENWKFYQWHLANLRDPVCRHPLWLNFETVDSTEKFIVRSVKVIIDNN